MTQVSEASQNGAQVVMNCSTCSNVGTNYCPLHQREIG